MGHDLMANPRRLGIVAATLATGSGLAYMAAAGAPRGWLAINAAALVIGLALLGIITRSRGDASRGSGGFVLAAGLGLLATALFGMTIEETARWVRVGVVTLQPSLILLPLMIVSHARQRDRLAATGLAVAALALALQPDRAMAGALLAGTAAVALQRRTPATRAVLAAAAAGFAVTLWRADALPATPFVEQVFASAFAFTPFAGAGLAAAALLLLLPALASDARARDPLAPVFGAVWLAIMLAALLGNYPTPVIGYGGSGILGYLLCLAALPARIGAPVTPGGATRPADPSQPRRNSPMVSATPMTMMPIFNIRSGNTFKARAPR